PELRPLLRSRHAAAELAAFAFLLFFAAPLHFRHGLADRITELCDLVANRRSPFEVEGLRGLVHFGLKLRDVFLSDVLRVVRAADGGVCPSMSGSLSLDSQADAFAD